MRKVIALALALLAAGTFSVCAQNYPSHVITIIVPYPAGGPTDTIARLSGRADAVGARPDHHRRERQRRRRRIGVGRVAHAAPDGYTVSIGHVQTHVFNPAIMKLDYDVVNDFEPVSLIADTPIWIIARKTLPADDLKGLIAWLKEQNGKATMGTVGVGGPTDVAGRIFEKETGTTFQIVPYRGGAPLRQDLLGGHIDFDVRTGGARPDLRPER